MTTVHTAPEPSLDGVSCAALKALDGSGRPRGCWAPAVAWVTAGSGRYPACVEHAGEPEQALVGTLELAGRDPAQELRLSALEQAVHAMTSPSEGAAMTVERARAFYAFLAAEEQPATTEQETTDR